MEPADPSQPRRRHSVRRKDERVLRNQINRYNQLFHIGQLITSEMGFDHLFEVIVEQTKEVMDSDRCSVFLIDEQELNLTAFVSTDLKRNEIVLPKTTGVAGWVFNNKIPLIVSDAYKDSRFYQDIDEKTGFQTRNILCVPLVNRENKCIGTLQALNKKSGDFDQDDKEILLHLANYVTIALENSRLYEKLMASDKAKQNLIKILNCKLPSNNRKYPEIITSIEKGLSLSMDSGVLGKLFVGLLKNAIENTPDEGRIKVSAQSIENQIRVEIQDNGIGITEEHQKNIFGGFLPAQDTELYASKTQCDFNAVGMGLDLLRIKIFPERFDFGVAFESTRYKYIPQDTDLCPGKISDCKHIKNRSECLSSGVAHLKSHSRKFHNSE